MASVWTALEVTNVYAHLAMLVNAVRVMLTNACQTPVTPEGPTTVFSSQTATDVNAVLDIQVLMCM